MGTVLPFAERKPFDPDTCDAMGAAFESAWQRLLVAGTDLAASSYADATREALAMHIIDSAKQGVHDVNRLRDDAVVFVLREQPHHE